MKARTSTKDRLKLFWEGRARSLFVPYAVPEGRSCYFSRLSELPGARKAREMKKLTSMYSSIDMKGNAAGCEPALHVGKEIATRKKHKKPEANHLISTYVDTSLK